MVDQGTGRTAADTWDLASSVGATATMVAAGRARANRAQLIDDRFAEPLVAAVGIDFFTRWATGELSAVDVDLAGHPWGMQPMTDLLVVRTRLIDAFLAEAMAAGIGQVVILASGLDARGYRLSWLPGVVLFEVDQPQVIEFKQATLAAIGAAPTVELRAVPIDLRHDWPAALRAVGFDPMRATAWVAEGLLGYLPSGAQDRFLDDITALSAAGSRLVAEHWPTAPEMQQVWQAATKRWYEHGLDVPLDNLGYYDLNDPMSYLGEHGWRSVRTNLSQLLAASGLTSTAPDDSEHSAAQTTFHSGYYFLTAQRPDRSD